MNKSITRTCNNQPQRLADFTTLTEALEYAASGVTGCNFYDTRGRISAVLPYRDLRDAAQTAARRLLSLGLQRGDHVALIADTEAEFIILFFACQYAALVPFAMPVPVNLGSHKIYVHQLQSMLREGDAVAAFASIQYVEFLREAESELQLRWIGTPEQLERQPEADSPLEPSRPDEPAYIQFTSGSTRQPQGVVITGTAIMSNLYGIVHSGLKVGPGDRCASWLPFYHDMGLVGFVLGPMVTQLSVDYLRTRDFAIRPLQWLRLLSRNQCSIAFSPPFGFDLCARRVRDTDLRELDLTHWRIAGVGAEIIRPRVLENFAQRLAPAGFNPQAFLPCYGLAESSLAASFAEIGHGLVTMYADNRTMTDRGLVIRMQAAGNNIQKTKVSEIVNCGSALPGHAFSIVDEDGNGLPELRIGRVMIRGPSLMSGYLNNPEANSDVFTRDGWLDTGDLGYLFENDLYLTGRRKDLIIVNGRNIRAIDLEEFAEEQPEVRMGDASAFEIRDAGGHQLVILVVECRLSSPLDRQSLIRRLRGLIYSGFGIQCVVDSVPPHTLPRTSSGKLSRVAAREGYIERAKLQQPQTAVAGAR